MNSSLPKAENWNKYWGLDSTQNFTKISWSKKRIMTTIGPFLQKGFNALDAGCGSGFFAKYFCDYGMHTTALDYSVEALRIAQEKTQGKAELAKCDLVNDDLRNILSKKYDIIFTDGLFEHFTEDEKDSIMKNLINVLKENGAILTFVPNKFSPWELIRPFYMPGIEEKPFTMKQLVDLNKRNQLRVIQQGGVNTFPFRFSPDKIAGSHFGMLLYTICRIA
jgi:SAM-dependent methyltransferase